MELKKVLLIGGSGFVGGAVANRLAARGIRVVIPARHRKRALASVEAASVRLVAPAG